MHNADLFATNLLCVLESVSQNPLRGLAGDELDGLNDTVNNNVLDAGVFTLGVLTDQNNVNVIVRGLVACNGLAGTEVGEKVECAPEGEVKRDVALADGCGERALEGDVVALNAVDGCVGDDGLSVLELGSDIAELPLDWRVGGREDVLDGLCDLGTNTVTFYE